MTADDVICPAEEWLDILVSLQVCVELLMDQSPRLRYRPSGYIDFVRTMLVAPVGILVVAGLAALLMWAGESGCYFIVVTPVVLALPLAGFAYLAAQWARIRNPNLACALAAALGLIMYLGRYYALMIFLGGPRVAARIDVLPRFVAFNVNNQVLLNDKGGANNPSPLMNWFLFAAELVACSAMVGVAAAHASRKPYCEQCGKWMSSKAANLRSGGASIVVRALDAGTLDRMDPQEQVQGALPPAFSRIEVVGCTHGGQDQAATFYLTASETVREGEKTTITKLLDEVALTPDEFLTLAEKCPGLMA